MLLWFDQAFNKVALGDLLFLCTVYNPSSMVWFCSTSPFKWTCLAWGVQETSKSHVLTIHVLWTPYPVCKTLSMNQAKCSPECQKASEPRIYTFLMSELWPTKCSSMNSFKERLWVCTTFSSSLNNCHISLLFVTNKFIASYFKLMQSTFTQSSLPGGPYINFTRPFHNNSHGQKHILPGTEPPG